VTKPLADPAAAHLRSLIAGRRVGGPESLGAEVGLPHPDDVAGGVEDTLSQMLDRVPPDEIGDPREFRQALETLLREAARVAAR